MPERGIFIIAEAGVNHNGSLETAKKLVDSAAQAGADCVKFQTYITEEDTSVFAAQADYQKQNTGDGAQSQYEMLKKLELDYEEFRELKRYCEEKGILFLSSAFELRSIDFLEELGIPFWKIASSEITNYPFLKKIAQTGKPIVMSTGMCTLQEIRQAMDVLLSCGDRKIVLLQCNTEYPTPMQDVNLRAMLGLQREFGCPVGYSDHTQGIEIAVAAAALGAVIIEKHFTLDKQMEGPDHIASLEPKELETMVRAIRNVETALGSADKEISESERKNRTAARKSIVAARDIRCGEILTEENIAAKRPGGGISPMRWEELLGQRAVRDFKRDEMIEC